MIAKPKAIKLIKEHQDRLIAALELEKYNITITCISSKKATICKKESLFGITHFPHDDDDAVIYIYHNEHKTLDEIYNTLLHELLHVKFSQLNSDSVNNRPNLHHKHEEELVLFFERLLKDKI